MSDRRRLPSSRAVRAFTLLELVLSLAIGVVLLSLILPALARARASGARQSCQSNLRQAGYGWQAFLSDHEQRFPFVPNQPGWRYAGYRFSSVDGTPFPDTERPLTTYLPLQVGPEGPTILCCPSDAGITSPGHAVGTGDRTAFRSYGTSYRANHNLLDSGRTGPHDEPCALCRSDVLTVPSRLVVMGDAVWYERREATGRTADWHGDDEGGNLLFLDGSVKYQVAQPKPRVGPAVFEPRLRSE